MKKILAVVFAMIFGGLLMSTVISQPTYAACGETGFLGLRPWYHGLATEGDNCDIKIPQGGNELPNYVWTIVLNVLVDLFVVAGLIATGFVIWGGFKYMMAGGEPYYLGVAKKTIVSALIGLVISALAAVITNTFVSVFTSGGN